MADTMSSHDVDALVEKLPVDQAHMLRAVSLAEGGDLPLYPDIPRAPNLFGAVERVIDTDEWSEVNIWQWKKLRGKEVPDESPYDPRRELKALSKLRKADMIPFAIYTSIPTGENKGEMLEQLMPFFESHPIFHQMLFSLVNNRLLTIEARDVEEVEGTSLFVKMEGDLKSVQRCLDARWESDREILRGLLNDFLIGAFELEDTLLGQALLDTYRRHSVPDEDEMLAVSDIPMRVPGNTTTSAYGVVLWILTSIDLKPKDRVLICGAKGGLTAALAKRVVGPEGEVRVLEWNEETVDWARTALENHGFTEEEVQVLHQDDVTIGSGDEGYWNAIVMNGSMPKIPYPLLDQLDDESGRLLFFMAVRGKDADRCWVIRKNDEVFDVKDLSNFLFTPIRGIYGWDNIEELQVDYKRVKQQRQEKALKERFEELERFLPYPLSRAFRVASNAQSPDNQHKKVIRLYELLDKYLAFIALSSADAHDCMTDSIKESLAKVHSRPSSGDWIKILRDTLDPAINAPELNQVAESLNKKLDGPEVLNCFQMMQKECGKEKAGRKQKVRMIDFLGQVVSYRNLSQEGHGRLRGKGDLENNANCLREAFIELMSGGNPIMEWTLFQVDSNDTRAGKVHYGKHMMTGNTFHFNTSVEKTTKPLDSKRVYLDTGDGVPLMISPWLAFGEGNFHQSELFVFKAKDRYETYHNGDVYPPTEEKEMLQSLISRHPFTFDASQKKDIGEEVFEALLEDYVEDGLLEIWEIKKLVEKLLKYELVQDEEEGEREVLRIAEERFPDVVIERPE